MARTLQAADSDQRRHGGELHARLNEKSLIMILLILGFASKAVALVSPALGVDRAAWLHPIVVSLAYIGISAALILAGGSLESYHVGYVSVALLLLLGITLPLDPENAAGIAMKGIVWATSAGLFITMLLRRVQPIRPTWKELAYLIPAVVGAGLLVAAPTYIAMQKTGLHVQPENLSAYLSAQGIGGLVVGVASSTAVPEEFIFRGLLWGGLLKESYPEGKAAVLQGVLFWMWHFDRAIPAPLSFWILIPAVTAFLSFLAWRSRSLLPPIAAHTAYNVFGALLPLILQA